MHRTCNGVGRVVAARRASTKTARVSSTPSWSRAAAPRCSSHRSSATHQIATPSAVRAGRRNGREPYAAWGSKPSSPRCLPASKASRMSASVASHARWSTASSPSKRTSFCSRASDATQEQIASCIPATSSRHEVCSVTITKRLLQSGWRRETSRTTSAPNRKNKHARDAHCLRPQPVRSSRCAS